MYQCDITLWSWESVTLFQIKFRLAFYTEAKWGHILKLWYIPMGYAVTSSVYYNTCMCQHWIEDYSKTSRLSAVYTSSNYPHARYS